MRCQQCGETQATIVLRMKNDGQVAEAALCQPCWLAVRENPQELFGILGQSTGTGAGGPGGQRGGPGPGSGVGVKAPRAEQAGILGRFGRDLTVLAGQGQLDPVLSRAGEIERMVQILLRRSKNNPVLVGPAGVGKTALVEGLAQRIAGKEVPEELQGRRVVALDVAALLAGTRHRGEFEERAVDLVRALTDDPSVILFIDELHAVLGAGAAAGGLDLANILKPALARRQVQVIGATTLDEYRRHIEPDGALERRFQPVRVDEPAPDGAVEILAGLRPRYEAHHRVELTDGALAAAVRLSHRYIKDRYLPDKAVDLIDEAAARVRMAAEMPARPENAAVQAELQRVQQAQEEAVSGERYDEAARLRNQARELQLRLQALEADRPAPARPAVTDADVAAVVADWTGIPVTALTEAETERLLRLEERLHGRVVGQEQAVSAVARAVRRARAGLKDPKRPIGSFLFVGPTGTGKTLVAKTLAETLFGDADALVRIDMSEYMEPHTVSRLIGAPPGYVGYDEPGQLTEAVRRNPHTVLLLDELEKAHPEVLNALLQVLEEGRLTDGKGRTVDFRNTVIIMTSNVGSRGQQTRRRPLGFVAAAERAAGGSADEPATGGGEDATYREAVAAAFRPEFNNRIDEVVSFRPLNREQIARIAELELGRVADRLAEQGLRVEVTGPAREYLITAGFDPEYGARPLRRLIEGELETVLAEAILRRQPPQGETLTVDREGDGLVVR